MIKYIAIVIMIVASTMARADGTFTFNNVTFSDGVTTEYCAVVTVTTQGCVPAVTYPPAPDYSKLALTNVSIRGRVGHGDDVVILGFIIPDGQPRSVTILARGPSLSQYGVKDALQDPTLTVVNQATGQIVDYNDSWDDPERVQAIIGSGHPPEDSREAATMLTLQPGAYTAIMGGMHGGTGVGIIELFPR